MVAQCKNLLTLIDQFGGKDFALPKEGRQRRSRSASSPPPSTNQSILPKNGHLQMTSKAVSFLHKRMRTADI